MAGRMLTTREVAERLGVCPETVLRRWRSGEIPGYRIADKVLRFDADEIENWLATTWRGPAESRLGRLYRERPGGAATPPAMADDPKEVIDMQNRNRPPLAPWGDDAG